MAVKNNYCRPSVDESGVIEIHQGRHPVVEAMRPDALFVPNDTYMGRTQDRVSIITGPNMAGKSTYMRQVALMVLMAQIGSFVPAKAARLGIVDRVFTRIGASDDLSAGQSTFMVEMTEVSDILHAATDKSLLILDEIGRGTSTFDGMSIARAVLEYCADPKRLGAKTLFATHYHELTALDQTLSNVRNYNIAVRARGEDIIFLRKIVPGGADRSYGIEVAKLAGLPDAVVSRARKILRQLEEEFGSRLIVRTTKSIEVTPRGQELYACACGIVHLRDDLLRSWSDEDEKVIRIGASTIPSAYILPQILPAFRREHPAPQFHVFQSDSEGIAEGLLTGSFDVGLIGARIHEEALELTPFYEDRMVLITPVNEHFRQLAVQGVTVEDQSVEGVTHEVLSLIHI